MTGAAGSGTNGSATARASSPALAAGAAPGLAGPIMLNAQTAIRPTGTRIHRSTLRCDMQVAF
jgi:hypothetical protein